MAPRKPKTAPAPAVVAKVTAVQPPAIYYLPNPMTVSGMIPKTSNEISIRDAIRA